MPKPKNDRKLYEKCWGCDGTRKLTKPAHLDITRTKSRNAQVGEDCPLCEDGYVEVGATAGQLERAAKEREHLAFVIAELHPAAKSALAFVKHTLEFFNWAAFPSLEEETRKLQAKLEAALR